MRCYNAVRRFIRKEPNMRFTISGAIIVLASVIAWLASVLAKNDERQMLLTAGVIYAGIG
jgi:hypothetical protein